MTGALHRLGALCVRGRVVVLVAWVLLAAGLGTWASGLGTQVDDGVTLPGSDSQRAADVLAHRFGTGAENGTNPIVLRAPAGARLDASPYRQAIERVMGVYGDDLAVLASVGPFSPAGAAQLSSDGRIGSISLKLRDGPAQLTTAEARHVLGVAQRLRALGVEVAAGGYLGAVLSQPAATGPAALGLLAALVVLLMTFGSVVATGLPILSALLGLGVGLALVALLSQVVQVPSAAPALATMIGLGVGSDFALLVVARHRAERAEGVELRESIARAIATAGGVVLLVGGTVTIALCSLLVARAPLVTRLGYLSAIAVLAAVAATLTLLPAALAFVGRRIDALTLPGRRGGAPAGAWARWARGIAARPWPALAAALLAIAVLALPLRTLQLGQSDPGQLPRATTARQAHDLLSEGFGRGVDGPLLVTVTAGRPGPATVEQVARLGDALTRTAGVVAVSPPTPAPGGTAALFVVTPASAPAAPATRTLVHTLRGAVLPAATRGTQLHAHVGGATAGSIDLASAISARLPLVIASVLVLAFLLLLVASRAPLVALTTALTSLLSTGAALGVVTFAFAHGRSAQLLGLAGAAPIVAFVPPMTFAIVFGLSTGHALLVTARVRERWRTTGDAPRAVGEGLAGTARTLTAAALVMVVVCCAFLLDGSPAVKQLGLGIAAGVAVDATVIRLLLVPAILALLGRSAWWLPRWLDRVTPAPSVEA